MNEGLCSNRTTHYITENDLELQIDLELQLFLLPPLEC